MAIDAALGRLGIKEGVCTSSTRPANPFEGQLIYETDTNRTLVYDNAAWLVVADNQVLSIDTTNSRVGIGTTTPTSELHIAGDVVIDSSVPHTEALRLTAYGGGSDLSTLIGGSDSGGLIETLRNSHLALGIRENGGTDSVSIVSGGGNYLNDSTYDTIVAKFHADGNVLKPNQPCFRAYHSADITYSSLNNPIPFNVTEFNIGNNYSTSTYSFTAPVDGVYLASAYLHWRLDSAFLYQFLRFHVNGSSVGIEHMRSGLKDYDVFGGQSILQLSQNDSLNVHWGHSGIDAGFSRGGTNFNSFEVYFLG